METVVLEEAKLLGEVSKDKQILELRRQGYGIEKIAKTLGITTYAVRKFLPKED